MPAQSAMKESIVIYCKNFLGKAFEFIRRDVRIMTSYRLFFIMNAASIIISVASFYFLSKTFGPSSSYLRPYGGEYFPFILIGMAFFNFVFTGVGAFSSAIRDEQLIGTIESLLVSPTSLSVSIVLMSLWSFLYSSIIVAAYLIVGVFFFNCSIHWSNAWVCIVFLLPSIIIFSSLGIISASFVLVFKKGDPVKWLIAMGSSFLSGTFFPVEVLPQHLQQLSKFIPTTYTLRSLRLSLLNNISFVQLLPDFAVLCLFCLIVMPLSVIVFKYAIQKVRRDGALAYY